MAKNGIEPMETDKPIRKIHFGSLEEVERVRVKQQQQQAGGTSVINPAVLAGIKAGNINIAESEKINAKFCYIEIEYLILV